MSIETSKNQVVKRYIQGETDDINFPITFQYFDDSDITVMKRTVSPASKTMTVDVGTDIITAGSNHNFVTGQSIVFTEVTLLSSPLVAGTTYYVIYVDADEFKVATTYALAVAGTAIDLASSPNTDSGDNTVAAVDESEIALDVGAAADEYTLSITPDISTTQHPTGALSLANDVILNTALVSGEELLIIRDVAAGDITQDNSFLASGEGKQIEESIDKNNALIAEHKEELGRGPKLPRTYDRTNLLGDELVFPEPIANGVIRYNNAGTQLEGSELDVDDLGDVDTTTTPPTNGQVLGWDGTNWVPQDDTTTDHGSLNGLADDDHTQYHTDGRGDNRYFQKTEHIDVSAGAADAGKPIKLDANGLIPVTMDRISSGAGAPGTTPTIVGEIYIDTTNDDAYISIDTTGAGDWVQVNESTLSGLTDTTITAPSNGQHLTYNGSSWVNTPSTSAAAGNTRVGIFNTDGEYSVTDIFVDPDSWVENIYYINVGANQQYAVTFKSGAFANQKPGLVFSKSGGSIPSTWYDGGNIAVFSSLNDAGAATQAGEFRVMGTDYLDPYTKSEGEVYGPEKCPIVSVPGVGLYSFGYDAVGPTRVLAWQDSTNTYSTWISVSTDGYSFASKLKEGTGSATNTFGNNIVTQETNNSLGVYRPIVNVVDSTSAYALIPSSDAVSVAPVLVKIDLTGTSPVGAVSDQLAPDPSTAVRVLRNVNINGSAVYGNHQLLVDKDAVHGGNEHVVVICQSDLGEVAIQATKDPEGGTSAWLTTGGEAFKDANTAGSPLNIQIGNTGQTNMYSAWSYITPISANNSRVTLIYTEDRATPSGNSTGQDLLVAQVDIDFSSTTPTTSYKDVVKLVRQGGTGDQECLVGIERVGDVVHLLSVSLADTVLYQKLNLTTIDDITASPITFTDHGDISLYADGVGTAASAVYETAGQYKDTTGFSVSESIQHDNKTRTQIYSPGGNTLLILHPILLEGHAGTDVPSFALITIPDYTSPVPIMKYIKCGTLHDGTGISPWDSNDYYYEPQFIESDNKLFIVWKMAQNAANALAYGAGRAIEVDLTKVGELPSMVNELSDPYFGDTFGNLSTGNVTLTEIAGVGTESADPQITRADFTTNTCRLISDASNEGVLRIEVNNAGWSAGDTIQICGIWHNIDHYYANSAAGYEFVVRATETDNTTANTAITSYCVGRYADSTPACVISSNEARFSSYENSGDNWIEFQVEATIASGDDGVTFFLANPELSSTVYLTGVAITRNDIKLSDSEFYFTNNTKIGNPEKTTLANYGLLASRDRKSFAYTSNSRGGVSNGIICIDDFQAKT